MRRPIELAVAGAGAVLVAGAIVAFAAAGGAAANAGPSTDGATGGNAVAIVAFTFGPADASIGVGETVTWTNQDAFVHTVRADSGSPIGVSDDLAEGATYAVTFDTAGTYDYVCGIHANMRGTVTVTG